MTLGVTSNNLWFANTHNTERKKTHFDMIEGETLLEKKINVSGLETTAQKRLLINIVDWT